MGPPGAALPLQPSTPWNPLPPQPELRRGRRREEEEEGTLETIKPAHSEKATVPLSFLRLLWTLWAVVASSGALRSSASGGGQRGPLSVSVTRQSVPL